MEMKIVAFWEEDGVEKSDVLFEAVGVGTIHGSGCSIRNFVRATTTDGEPRVACVGEEMTRTFTDKHDPIDHESCDPASPPRSELKIDD